MSGSKLSYKREIADEYCDKYPEATTMALARLLHKDYPLDFNSVENARFMIRASRGEGHKNRRSTAKTRTEKQRKQAMAKTYQLPESDYNEIHPLHLAKSIRNVLFLTDIHLPYQDNDALKLAIDYGIAEKVDCVYLNGDTLDIYQASRFTKDRRLRDLAGELEMGRQFLRMLKDTFDCPIYFKIGNHEDRWQKYLMQNAPELLGIAEFKLSNLLRFGELGIVEVLSTQTAYAGKLALLHGHEFGGTVYSPVNVARGLYTRAKESSICGHHHATSEHTEKSLSGDVVTTWSVGALCGLRPEYLPNNKWNHGFANIRIAKDGNYEVDNLRIIEGKIR